MAGDIIGTVRGTFLRPGISKNRRWYTPENIRSAVLNMNKRIATGVALDMKSSHSEAGKDNMLATVGKITKVWQNADGSADFEASVPNTSAGRDVAVLAGPGGWARHLSIRGRAIDDPRTVEGPDGEDAWLCRNLDIQGVDYTQSPGVEGAELHDFSLAESFAKDPHMIFEDVETDVFIESFEDIQEAGNAPGNGKLPYGDASSAKYADPGYQKDGKKRYPLNSPGRIRAAWSYINVASNAAKYTSAQVAAIKKKIKAAAGKAGIDISKESEDLIDKMMEICELYGDQVSIDDVDRLIFLMAEDDNNMDGLGGISNSSMSSVCPNGHIVDQNAMYCPLCGEPVPQAESEETKIEGEGKVPDTDANDKATITLEQAKELVAQALAEKDAADKAAAEAVAKEAADKAASEAAAKEAADKAAAEAAEAAKTGPDAQFTTESVKALVAEALAERTAAAEKEAEEAAKAAASQVDITEAIKAAVTEATETVRKELTEQYRQSGSGARKGFASSRVLTADGNVVESDGSNLKELTGADLAKMDQSSFRKLTSETFKYGTNSPWFRAAPRLAAAFADSVE